MTPEGRLFDKPSFPGCARRCQSCRWVCPSFKSISGLAVGNCAWVKAANSKVGRFDGDQIASLHLHMHSAYGVGIVHFLPPLFSLPPTLVVHSRFQWLRLRRPLGLPLGGVCIQLFTCFCPLHVIHQPISPPSCTFDARSMQAVCLARRTRDPIVLEQRSPRDQLVSEVVSRYLIKGRKGAHRL